MILTFISDIQPTSGTQPLPSPVPITALPLPIIRATTGIVIPMLMLMETEFGIHLTA